MRPRFPLSAVLLIVSPITLRRIYEIAAHFDEKLGISPLQPDHGLHSRLR